MRPRFFFKTAVIFMALYIAGTYFSMQARVLAAREENAALYRQQAVEQQKTAEMRDEAESPADRAFVMRKARELGYIVKDEEEIYINIYGKSE